MTVLLLLILAAVAVSLLIGALARLPTRQLLAQTLAMCAGALVFYGLVGLLG